MRKVLAISLVLLFAFATAAVAREIERTVPYLDDPISRGVPGGVYGVSQGTDTFFYGGTANSAPFYAVSPAAAGWVNRNQWTWASGGWNGVPHSGLPMDGWKGVDATVMEGDYFNVKDDATLGQACIISGDKSLFCGATASECSTLCFVNLEGTGYGNAWVQAVNTPTYTYDIGDDVNLDYNCTYDSEDAYDFTYVIVQIWDTIGSEWINYDTLAEYNTASVGVVAESWDLDGLYLPTPPVDFRIVFQFVSDGGYSDGDGLYPTVCGAFCLDDYDMDDNGTHYTENFETTAIGALPAGWSVFADACGDYARVEWLATLPVNLTADPCVAELPGLCAMEDSVLCLFDPLAPDYPHPYCQYNFAMSPIIDFSDHAGLPGRIVYWERFANLPLNDHVFMFWHVRYAPACESGGWGSWVDDNYVYYTPEGTRCALTSFDVSHWIPPDAEQAQVALGVINYCDEDPWDLGCTDENNVTPYYDNVTFGVYGSDTAPYISLRELDWWQDQFAEDGSLNPTSTADTRTANYLSNLLPPIFADTLVCRSAAANTEVWFVFRMAAVGPMQPVVHPFFTTWFPGVTGGAWVEVRMDTSEVTNSAGTGTVLVPDSYMCAFHEADVRALPEGTEIMPNQIFVPGTRIEYFLKACYTGSADTFYSPNAGQSGPEEFEILPMMADDGEGSVEWPCLIYADHFGQRGTWFRRNATYTREALVGNGYEFDMFNRLGPSSDLRNGIGRWAQNTGQIGAPGTPKYNWGPGATLYQMFAYTHCILNNGNIYGYCIYAADKDMLNSWLTVYSDASHQRFLWVSGDTWARELQRRTGWNGRTFLNNTLCTTYLASSYAVTSGDFTYCVPMNGMAGGRIVCTPDPENFTVRQNGCPRNYNIIGVSGSAGCAGVGEIEWNSAFADGFVDIAAVSNAPAGLFYKTFTEGYDYCVMRDPGGSPLSCGTWNIITTWFGCVLTWGGYSGSAICNPLMVSDVRDPGVAPAVVTSLGQAFPNPMNPTATIKFAVGTPGKVMLRVFDVSGRVIRTLVDETRAAGEYSVIWDGKNDGGDKVASGVFFYQLDAPGFKSAKKIVILQ